LIPEQTFISGDGRLGPSSMQIFSHPRKGARRPVKVLLVEDNDIDARIITLRAGLVEGFELGVTRVNTLPLATAAMESGDYDICLVDVALGRESAIQCLSALEQVSGCVGRVVLSHIAAEDAIELRLSAGANYFLPKAHCTPRHLEHAIEAVMAQRQFSAPPSGIRGNAG